MTEKQIVPYRTQHLKRIPRHEIARKAAAVEYLTEQEYTSLMQAAKNYPEHKLLIRLLWETGLRISEALALKHTDIYPDGINIRHGKGDKQRMVPCQPGLIGTLLRHSEDKETGKVFNKITTEPGSLYMLRRYANHACINKRVHPHLFRHSFAINFLKQTGDPFSLQTIGGWSDMETIKIYMRLAREMPAEAMAKMQFPEV